MLGTWSLRNRERSGVGWSAKLKASTGATSGDAEHRLFKVLANTHLLATAPKPLALPQPQFLVPYTHKRLEIQDHILPRSSKNSPALGRSPAELWLRCPAVWPGILPTLLEMSELLGCGRREAAMQPEMEEVVVTDIVGIHVMTLFL